VMLVTWARRSWSGLFALDAGIVASASMAVELLGRTSSFDPALRVVIPIAAAAAIAASLTLRVGAPRWSPTRRRRLLALAALAGAVAVLAGPASYSFANLGRTLNGNNVIAGPASASGFGGFGAAGGARPSASRSGFTLPSGTTKPSSGITPSGASGARSGPSGSFAGGQGGQLSTKVIGYLEAHQGSAKYLLAATGSQTTAPIIIATGKAVVTIGGFSGSDPAPTVSQLAKMVAAGELKYVLISSGGGMGGSSQSALTSWVKAHGTVVTAVSVSGGTLYKVG